MANIERLGFRFEDISKRHRTWGPQYCMWDLDFIVVEASGTNVVALVEYKRTIIPDRSHMYQIEALGSFAHAAKRPFFVVTYWPAEPQWMFRIQPANGFAHWDVYEHFDTYEAVENVTEFQYRAFLSYLQRRYSTAQKVAS